MAYFSGMRTLFAWVGASVGGWLGWAAGAYVGLMTAWMLSTVGTALGLYVGRWAASALLE